MIVILDPQNIPRFRYVSTILAKWSMDYDTLARKSLPCSLLPSSWRPTHKMAKPTPYPIEFCRVGFWVWTEDTWDVRRNVHYAAIRDSDQEPPDASHKAEEASDG